MSTYDNAYSRFIAWVKIALPLLALVLLSTLFLFSRGIGTDSRLPFSEVELEERARDTRITAPNFAGVTDDGTAISVVAAIARPDPVNSQILEAEELYAEIATAGGVALDIRSPAGRVDGGAREVTLRDGVEIETSTGYHITSETFVASVDGSHVAAGGGIEATGPFGRFEAMEMTLERTDDEAAGYLLVFNGGVKLIYQPQH